MNAVAKTFDKRLDDQRKRLEALSERQAAVFAEEYARMEAASHNDLQDEDCSDLG